MKTDNKIVAFRALTLALVCFLHCAPHAVSASASPVQVGPTKDGKAFWDGVVSSVSKLSDYECDSELVTYLADKAHTSKAKQFFKHNQFRIQAVGGGYRDGSVIVRKADGSVKAQGGLMLAYVKMSLDPDSRMLQLPNGSNAARTDFPTLVNEIKQMLAKGYECSVSANAVAEPGFSGKCYVVEISPSDGPTDPPLKRIFIDAATNVPVLWDDYRGGKKFCTATFKNLHVNAGIGDDLFQL